MVPVQKAQSEIEEHLKTAEMLSMKGDTKGQKEQIVNELLKVHTRFQARITEYQLLINMAIKFFQNLSQVCVQIFQNLSEVRDAHWCDRCKLHHWTILARKREIADA